MPELVLLISKVDSTIDALPADNLLPLGLSDIVAMHNFVNTSDAAEVLCKF